MHTWFVLAEEGSVEIELPTIWTDEAAEVGRVREEKRRRRSEKIKSQNYKDQSAWKGACRKVAKHGFVAPEDRKAGSLKRRVRSHLGRGDLKNCLRLRREANLSNLEVKTHEADMFGALLEVEMWKNCTAVWREAHFEVKMRKAHLVRTTFARSGVALRGRRNGFLHLVKSESNVWVLYHVQKRWQAWDIWRRCTKDVAGAVQETSSSDVRRSGRWFPENGCILEHQIFRFDKMILRDKSKIRVTCPHFFTAGAVWIDGVGELQNALVRGRQLCTQLPIFEGSLAELLRVLGLSTITFEGSLAEFLRFRWMDRQTDR